MEWRLSAFIWGTLLLIVGAIVGGFYLHSGPGAILIGGGIVGAIAWLMFVFNIIAAMNSDI